jgi:hypothetical protein
MGNGSANDNMYFDDDVDFNGIWSDDEPPTDHDAESAAALLDRRSSARQRIEELQERKRLRSQLDDLFDESE